MKPKSDMRSMTARSIACSLVTVGASSCRVPGIQKRIPKRRRSLKNFAAQAQAAVATREACDKRPVLIMAQDEGCFGRISRVKRCWAPPGVRPHAPAQVVREYVYVYTAVAPAQGKMLSPIQPEASTALTNLFLDHVRQTC